MKKIFVYYSFTGNGDVVSEHLKSKGFETFKVIRKKRMPKSFFFSVLHGGFLAGINHKDKLDNFNIDVDGYEEIVIGSPIWNGRFSSPVNTVLACLDLKDKNVKFVFYSGSGEGPKALKRINKEFPNSRAIFLKEPKKNIDELKKLEDL